MHESDPRGTRQQSIAPMYKDGLIQSWSASNSVLMSGRDIKSRKMTHSGMARSVKQKSEATRCEEWWRMVSQALEMCFICKEPNVSKTPFR